jgi:hypothetical protein
LIFGLILSTVIIREVPLNTQLVFIGAVLGTGADFLSALQTPGGPKTSVNRISKLVVDTSRAVLGAVNSSGLDEPEYVTVTVGIWSILGTIAFTLIVGNFF